MRLDRDCFRGHFTGRGIQGVFAPDVAHELVELPPLRPIEAVLGRHVVDEPAERTAAGFRRNDLRDQRRMPPSAMRSIASVIATSTFAYSLDPTPLPPQELRLTRQQETTAGKDCFERCSESGADDERTAIAHREQSRRHADGIMSRG